MAPKKKVEDEPPPPEDFLPPGWSLGCEVFWGEALFRFEEDGLQVRCGQKGTLAVVHELAEDGAIEFVDVKFDELPESKKVRFSAILREPPPLELYSDLSTGLSLPLRGKDVSELWSLHEDYDAQSGLISAWLRLMETFPVPEQRQIVCDFHLFVIIHARSLCLTGVQGAVFTSIMCQVLAMMKCVAVEDEKGPSKEQLSAVTASACFDEFQRLILVHSMDKPPECLQIFKGSEVRLLTDFVAQTFFKHFLLYQYCLNFNRDVETLRFGIGLSRPFPPPELSGARKVARKVKEEDPDSITDEHDDKLPGSCEPADGQEQGELNEDEEIERMVAEKLLEVEERLKAKVNQREEDFRQRMEEDAASGKKRGK